MLFEAYTSYILTTSFYFYKGSPHTKAKHKIAISLGLNLIAPPALVWQQSSHLIALVWGKNPAPLEFLIAHLFKTYTNYLYFHKDSSALAGLFLGVKYLALYSRTVF